MGRGSLSGTDGGGLSRSGGKIWAGGVEGVGTELKLCRRNGRSGEAEKWGMAKWKY